MKKILIFLLVVSAVTPTFGKAVENEMYFRAMKDEMNRTLKELRLPGELRPYYVAYHLNEKYRFHADATFGEVYASDKDDFDLNMIGMLKIGNDKNNNTGYYNRDRSWHYRAFANVIGHSYEGICQALWDTTNALYLEVIEQYKEKEAYRKQKNIQEQKPDVVPAPQGTYLEEIPAWSEPNREEINRWLEKVSSWGKELPFAEDFYVRAEKKQKNNYYLNSRGAKSQFFKIFYEIGASIQFRQPNGWIEKFRTAIPLRDFSEAELARAEQKIQEFLEKMHGLYGASQAEVYLGPVLYKPLSAGIFIQELLTNNLIPTVPLWQPNGEDEEAGPFRKRLGRRVMSPGITVYDRPRLKEYEGVQLTGSSWLDWEGVPTQELVLVADGRLQNLPLSQRPLEKAKGHQSNGHALSILGNGGVREDVSNIFVEPETPLTDEQMEEKLLARCKELDLEYCYIKNDSVFERIYTKDGRKEWIIGLNEIHKTERSLRDILAAGGKKEIVNGYMVVPSLLVDEVELEPQDRKPDRKPLVPKPQ